jgi:tRNA1(Val) A37 N6-methylase TrmN6
MTKYKNHFDVVFFSPPYYELELYPGSKQSTTVYKTYDDWLKGYWLNTMKVCKHVLKPGGKMCYILSSGGGPHSAIDILKDMNDIARTMFTLKTTIPMYNKNVHVTSGSHRETSEKIMVFDKR